MSPLDRLEWLSGLNDMQGVTPAMIKVAVALAFRFNSVTGQLNPSIGRLAMDTGLETRSVNRAISRLERIGVIKVKRSHGGAAKYTNQYCLIPLTQQSALTLESPLTVESDTPDRGVTSPLTEESPEQGIEQGNNMISASADAVPSNEGVEEPYITKRKRKLNGNQLNWFLQFWSAFDFKKGKTAAADAWIDAGVTEELLPIIIAAAKREAQTRTKPGEKGKAPKWGQGWLTERRWEDEAYTVSIMSDSTSTRPHKALDKILAEQSL
ncbi:MAG: hypothetical protein B6D76_09440 [gamma proteobacterium symbiont of Stewartia floridana]|nr:MAG: hypothetical protein B6D76_09440 [gamma proteobacterium symbiont of Stewartia floridana]